MIKGLDHINIRTADLEATKAFFIEVLGFTEGWRPNVTSPGAWLYSGGRALVHVSVAEEPPAPSRGNSLDHFAFSIEDFDAVQARLDAHGIKYRANSLPDGAIRQLICRDPSGVTVELNWRDAARAPT